MKVCREQVLCGHTTLASQPQGLGKFHINPLLPSLYPGHSPLRHMHPFLLPFKNSSKRPTHFRRVATSSGSPRPSIHKTCRAGRRKDQSVDHLAKSDLRRSECRRRAKNPGGSPVFRWLNVKMREFLQSFLPVERHNGENPKVDLARGLAMETGSFLGGTTAC